MKTSKLLLLAVLIVSLLIVAKITYVPREEKTNPPLANQNTLSSQTSSEGEVTVKVTPENIPEDKKTWQFRIVLDAHTGSLDQDLLKNSVLLDEKENQIAPIFWEGDPPGGHHREGILRFSSFPSKQNLVILKIRGIGEVPERNFSW